MDALWVLLVFHCFLLSCAIDDGPGPYSTEPNEETIQEIELFPPNPTYAGQIRKPRTLFKKLHSGAAFLTGLKLGALLSKKGFELGHGKIASTHSFQIFGKPVNSAMSLTYGNINSLLPFVDDNPDLEKLKKTALDIENKNLFHVTVIEHSLNNTTEELIQEAAEEKNANENKRENLVLLYQDTVKKEPDEEMVDNFLKEHNKRVKNFNDDILRRKNSKF